MKITNRHLCSLSVLLPGVATIAASNPSSPAAGAHNRSNGRPNVILLVADDLGYGDLGCYGARGVTTPAVDSLAANGIRFTDCHAVASTSTPSRYSLLTGRYAWRRHDTDVARGDAGMIIRPEEYTLADLFNHAGYATGAIGKWHLGLGDRTGAQDWNAPLAATPADLGFDYHYIMAATADRTPCVFIEDGAVANYDSSAPIFTSYTDPFPGEPTARNNPELLTNQRSSHGHDQAIVNGIGRIGYMKGGGRALWKDENIADSITGHAVSFIRDHSHEPFFLYLATNDIHVPRFPHPRFRGASSMGLRGDAIAQFDWTVGRILETLDSLGIADKTLIILTSDNGPVLDDGYDDRAEELVGPHRPTGPFSGGKYSALEGGTAVPLIVSWPDALGSASDGSALLSHIDLFASMAGLLEARLPRDAAPDSRDCLSTLLGHDNAGVDHVVEMAHNRTLSIRTPRWKYIEPSDGPATVKWGTGIATGFLPAPQLFDIQADPSESVNRAIDFPETVIRLSGILTSTRQPR